MTDTATSVSPTPDIIQTSAVKSAIGSRAFGLPEDLESTRSLQAAYHDIQVGDLKTFSTHVLYSVRPCARFVPHVLVTLVQK